MSHNRKEIPINNEKQESPAVSQQVSDTAKYVASLKAAAQFGGWSGNRTSPLFKQKNPLISESDIQKYAQIPQSIKTSVAVRERFFNKQMDYYVKKENYKQILILGSGLDVRAFHKNRDNQKDKAVSFYENVKFYEVDCAAILNPKENFFKENHLNKNAEYIQANYTQDNFVEMLKDKGFDITSPTLIIWEGNSMYIEKSKIEKLFQDLKAFSQFTIVFDHFTRDLIEGPRENSIYALHKQGLWVTGFNSEDIQKFAQVNGMNTTTIVEINELKQEYQVEENPEPSHYLISTMRK